MPKLFLGLITSALFLLIIAYVKSQDEELAVVTIEMFTTLQMEVNDLNAQIGNLQGQLQDLGTNLQNLATDTQVVGSVELTELQALIDVSNQQDADIGKLISSNGIWQQNFRVINNTFERLRKVVVFPIPTLNNPTYVVSTAAIRRTLPAITQRHNVTVYKPSQRPKLVSHIPNRTSKPRKSS